MKQNKVLYFLVTSMGIGTAMSVALQDTAVGMAIGLGIGIAFAYSDQSSCSLKKNDPESKSESK